MFSTTFADLLPQRSMGIDLCSEQDLIIRDQLLSMLRLDLLLVEDNVINLIQFGTNSI